MARLRSDHGRETAGARKYTDDEVHAIIDHALRLQHGRTIDEEQLLALLPRWGIPSKTYRFGGPGARRR
ncbi:MAG TPA: hypothetical protein VER33_25315 [Polyangiaceae bacterium]|nr:hypothetical protein [Polyangiaceae bacterium]